MSTPKLSFKKGANQEMSGMNCKLERLVGLSDAVRELFAVLDAHEIDTFDCDRAGVIHCDCLERARKKVESMMPNAEAETSERSAAE